MIQLNEVSTTPIQTSNLNDPKQSTLEAVFGIANYFNLCVTDYTCARDFMKAAFSKMENEDLEHFKNAGGNGLKKLATEEIEKRGMCL